MPFEYLARLLSGGRSRIDHHEERIRRLENQLSKMSMSPRKSVGSSEREKTSRKQRKLERKPRRARSVYGSEGWKIPGSPNTQNELRVKDFGRDWVIEFECPKCGAVSREGVSHWNTYRANGHTKYGIYLDCKNCGWRSDLLTIRAFR